MLNDFILRTFAIAHLAQIDEVNEDEKPVGTLLLASQAVHDVIHFLNIIQFLTYFLGQSSSQVMDYW